MSTLPKVSELKRSFIYRDLVTEGASDTAGQAMTLLDFSLQKRGGIRGVGAASILVKMGLPIPSAPNQSRTGDSGEHVLRLSPKEFWVLDSGSEAVSVVDSLNQVDSTDQKCFPLFCQHSHAWFVMTGDHLAETFAKICGVDLRENAFPKGSIAQTSVARVNAIIVSHSWQGKPAFSILSDGASASYLWGALHDAMMEFSA